MNEEKKRNPAELTDEQVDHASGGFCVDSGEDYTYCPYCNEVHCLRRLGEYPMRSAAYAATFAEAFECGEHGRFYKVGDSFFDFREQQIG